ncbi:MAG: universal stress protein [Deltaproteobacteria bacterium]|jgi:nucleotide-binding universal stress UspA family protein|nr:universal stress protein [Deltaproteobacteria bacterium]
MKKKQKMLVPLDGSDRAMNTVKYITRIEPFLNANIVLFHVFSSVPEGFWDLESDPRSTATVKQVHAWEIQYRKNMQDYMESARQLLLNAGADAAAVKVKIQNRKTGFARDIIRESQNGYDALITRRRGMTGLRGIVLGSVATKLVEKLSFLPLILAGRKPPGNKILLTFDGSEGCWRSVDFVGITMGGFDFEVKLINVIRGKENSHPEIQRLYAPADYTESTRKQMTAQLAAAEKKLVDSGFAPDQISTELVSGVASRAEAIVAAAEAQNYGTIVMGRRGHSRVRDFFIGRVTNKVIHLARDRTVWVVR